MFKSTANLVCRKAFPNRQWDRARDETLRVADCFLSTGPRCLTRFGDGEMRLLIERRPEIYSRLLAAGIVSDAIGTPDNFVTGVHSWRAVILQEFDSSALEGKLMVIAVLPTLVPSLIPMLVANRRAIWVTHQAMTNCRNLSASDFCEFFGFEIGRSDAFLDTPPGRIYPYVPDPVDQFQRICSELETRADEYDIAVIGFGVWGKPLAAHVKTRIKRHAIDAGCILSAMRGERDRVVFHRELRDLVWDDTNPFKNRIRTPATVDEP